MYTNKFINIYGGSLEINSEFLQPYVNTVEVLSWFGGLFQPMMLEILLN